MINSSIVLIAVPFAILAIVAYVYLLRDDRRWILAAIPIHLIVFLEKTTKIDLEKLIYTGFFFPALFIWFFRKWLKRERIIERKDELVLVLFLAIGLISVFIAGYQDPSYFSRGFREYYIFIPYLFYFPVRDFVTSRERFNEIVWALLITCTIGAIYVVYIFKTATVDATHVWNVLWSRKNLSEPLYMTAILILLAMVASKAYKPRITFPLLAINILALGITLTRGYWGATGVGAVLLIIFLGKAARGRLIGFLTGGLAVVIATAAIVFPRIFEFLIGIVAARATSISFQSESLKDRLIESASVISKIKASPIIGHGFGATFSFYEILQGYTMTTWYIHNGYLFLLFKLGVVGAMMYLYFYFSRLIFTAKTARAEKDEQLSSMIMSFAVTLGVMLLVNVTSPQFDDKVPVLLMTVMWGAAAGIGRRQEN